MLKKDVLSGIKKRKGVDIMDDFNETAKKLMSAVYLDDENQKKKIENTREVFTEVAAFILKNMQNSREKSLVLTKLEEACMWAIKGITRE